MYRYFLYSLKKGCTKKYKIVIMKKVNWKLKYSLILTGGALLLTVPIVMTACSKTRAPNKLIQLNEQFVKNEDQYVSTSGSRMPIFDANSKTADKSIEQIISNAQEAIKSLETYKQSNKFSKR